jgi:regulatory protein
MAQPRKPLDPKRALEMMEDACARCELSSGEILEKLYRRGIGEADRNAILASLIKNRFVDDRRFASAFIKDRLTFARWGRRKIAPALAAKRVARNIIDEAFDEIDEDEYYATLLDVMKAKMRSAGEITSRDEYIKILRYGIQRGFETDLVVKAVKELRTRGDDDDDVEEDC